MSFIINFALAKVLFYPFCGGGGGGEKKLENESILDTVDKLTKFNLHLYALCLATDNFRGFF